MFAFTFACEQVLSHCLSQLMSAVACRTEAYNKRPKGIMGGGSSPRFSEVRSTFCQEPCFCEIFLSGITYAITEFSHEQTDL